MRCSPMVIIPERSPRRGLLLSAGFGQPHSKGSNHETDPCEWQAEDGDGGVVQMTEVKDDSNAVQQRDRTQHEEDSAPDHDGDSAGARGSRARPAQKE
ncbi:hypothetical protein GCM10018953_71930 [Streptosporangium nondiastaticum]